MTTPDLLYRTTDILTALRATLDGALPADVDVHTPPLPVTPQAPYVLLELTNPRMAGPGMAGDQWADVEVRATSVGVSLLHAAAVGDLVREVLIGRDSDGRFRTPIVLAGRTVADRRGNQDGAGDTAGGVPQWTETFGLHIVRGASA